jgi:hypothetical protein
MRNSTGAPVWARDDAAEVVVIAKAMAARKRILMVLTRCLMLNPSLRAQRSNPSRGVKKEWIASSLRSSQ